VEEYDVAEKMIRFPLWLRCVLSAIAGLWVYSFFPVMQKLGLIMNAGTFIPVFVVLCLLVLIPWRWLQLGIAIITTYLYMFAYFRSQQEGLLKGAVSLLYEEVHQIPLLWSLKMPDDPFQTQGFLLLICALFGLVRFAIYRSHLWVFYNVLGITLLIVIDVNTGVPTQLGVSMLVASTLLVLGLLHITNTWETLSLREMVKWIMPVLGLLIVCVGLPFFFVQQWTKPELNLDNRNVGVGGGVSSGAAVKMIGYQLDNTHLGGPFEMSTTPELLVTEKNPTYLRGQTLSTYTGKGWISADLSDLETKAIPLQAPFPTNFQNLSSQSLTQAVEVLSDRVNTKYLLSGYSLARVKSLAESSAGSLTYDLLQGNVFAPMMGKGQFYTVVSSQMENPYYQLAEDHTPYANEMFQVPPKVVMVDLHLPNTLPARVHALAVQMVGKEKTEYGMVSAVRSYLDQEETYSNDNVAVPGPTQDYVDQFLFDTHVGYCNNFSSAMAVLLRTLNIPTRWVTGFTAGQFVSVQGKDQQYLIEDKDAHSWVEVYFPKFGWVPFDPTPGYNYQFAPVPVTGSGSTKPVVTRQPTQPKPPKSTPVQVHPHVATNTLWNTRKVEFIGFGGMFIVLCFGASVIRRMQRRRKGKRNEELTLSIPPTSDELVNGALRDRIQLLVARLKDQQWLDARHVTLRDVCEHAAEFDVPAEASAHLLAALESHWYGGRELSPEDLSKIMSTLDTWIEKLNMPLTDVSQEK
jgi:Transglutaminase-like superfamily/TgpA N-terminal domain/Domain of unknown function (DUF4129)